MTEIIDSDYLLRKEIEQLTAEKKELRRQIKWFRQKLHKVRAAHPRHPRKLRDYQKGYRAGLRKQRVQFAFQEEMYDRPKTFAVLPRERERWIPFTPRQQVYGIMFSDGSIWDCKEGWRKFECRPVSDLEIINRIWQEKGLLPVPEKELPQCNSN